MTATRNPRGRRWAAAASAATLVAAGMVLSGSTAAQAFDAAQACTDAHPFKGEVPAYTRDVAGDWPMSVPGYPGGYVHLFYEGERGYNCAIAVSAAGEAYLDVGIRTEGGEPDIDVKQSASRTDPVLIPAKGECVQVTAAVGDRSAISPFGNCEE